MRTASHPAPLWWDQATARLFSDEDDYVLPEGVHTNIPRQCYFSEPGAWNRARGILVHLCRDLRGTPIALYYRPLETRAGDPNGAVVTAIAHDEHGHLITVVWRQTARAARRRSKTTWQLTVNGVAPPRGTGHRRPPASWLARVAWRTAD